MIANQNYFYLYLQSHYIILHIKILVLTKIQNTMKKIYIVKLLLTCFTLLLGLAIFAQPAVLQVHYKFDETSGTAAADASGNGNNGTIAGTVNWVEGTLGGALELVTDAGVTIPAALMSMTSDNGSISLWVKCITPTSIYTLWSGGDNLTGGGFGPENEMHLHLEQPGTSWTGGEVSFWILGNAANTFLFSDPAKGDDPAATPVTPTLVADDAWHHIAVTWGGTAAAMYIDGVKIVEKAYATASFALSNMFFGQMLGGGRRFIGIMDDARVYTGVLNEFEIGDLFNKVTYIDNHVANDVTQLSTYPNPAADVLNVRFISNTPGKAKISLLSLTGQVLETIDMDAAADYNNATFDVSKYSNGVYFVKLEVNGEISHTKVVFK